MTALRQLPLLIPCAVARQEAAPPRLLRMGFAQGGA